MKTAYPTLIKKSGDSYVAYIPDIQVNTEGSSFCEAIEMARDAIGGWCTDTEPENIPMPSSEADVIAKAKSEADDDVDFSDGVLTFVDIDTEEYRKRIMSRAVKKNCSIPAWLNEKAERQGVNFSRVLQDALIEIVGAN